MLNLEFINRPLTAVLTTVFSNLYFLSCAKLYSVIVSILWCFRFNYPLSEELFNLP